MNAIRHFITGTRFPPSKHFDPWSWSKGYRRGYFAFSRLRQLRHGSHIARLNEPPCPTCHGNDRVSNVREGWACLHIHCDRCGEDYRA